MARIVGRSRLPHRLEIHPKYVAGDRIGEFVGRRSGSYLVFDVNARFADTYAAELPALILKAGKHVGHEENVELRLLQRNDGGADVSCFDRQVQVPGTRRTGRHRRLDVEERPRPGCHRGETLPRQPDTACSRAATRVSGNTRPGSKGIARRCGRIVPHRVQAASASRTAGTGPRTCYGRHAGHGSGDRWRLQSALKAPAAGAPAGGDARTADLPVGTGSWRV